MKRQVSAALIGIMVCVFLSGCVKSDDIILHDVFDIDASFAFPGPVKVDATLKIENNSGSNIRLEDIKLHISDLNYNELAQIRVNHQVTFPKRALTDVPVTFYIKFDNPLTALSLLRRLQEDPGSALVSGEAVARAGLAKKKFHIADVPFTDIFAKFGGNAQE